MKRLILILPLICALWAGAPASGQSGTPLFPYPTVPESISVDSLQARYDYFVSHFWDNATPERHFRNDSIFASTFEDYLSILPEATIDTVFSSISRLMGSVAELPEQAMLLANLAERFTYSDSASVPSDILYMRFVEPVIRNRNVERAYREAFQSRYARLHNTQVGRNIIPLSVTDRDGNSMIFEPDTSKVTILFLSDPDCMDCSMARGRLNGNIRANELLRSGELEIVVLCEMEPGRDWEVAAKSYPTSWTVLTTPELDAQLDLRAGVPSFYVLSHGVLIGKHIQIDQLINILAQI